MTAYNNSADSSKQSSRPISAGWLFLSALFVSGFLAVIIAPEASAQSGPVPTTPPSETALIDTAQQIDSLNSVTITVDTSKVVLDSSAIIAARITDSINAAYQVDTTTAITPFRFGEFAAALTLRTQREQKKNINEAYYQDAGDFFRADRSFFTVDYLTTPVRHTVSAFGLPGPRVTPIFDGRSLSPLEHLPEQDGLTDFNDIPTASVGDVYTIQGPLAAFLGGESGVAGIWLQKIRADGPQAESRLEVQKGPFGYAYTKGIISETLPNGFSYTAALGFRKTVSSGLLSNDDASHQFWEIESPYKKDWRITTSVRLYRREADIVYKSHTLSAEFKRDRRDRDIIARLERIVDNNNSLSFEFRHQRAETGSDATIGTYKQNFDHIDNGLTATWNHREENKMLALTVRGSREKLEFKQGDNQRNRGLISMKGLLRLSGEDFSEMELPVDAVHPSRQENFRQKFENNLSASLIFGELALTGAGGYSALPRANIGYIVITPNRSLSFALGVTPVFPRQYELDLPFENTVTQSIVDALSQSGNGSLTPEKQYTASAEAKLGNPNKQFSLSVTGGKIIDGINWRTSPTDVGLLYRPLNEDFTFVGATINQRYPLTKWLSWNGSASYYKSNFDSTTQPTYAPEYNLFSGLALNFYFRPLEMHISGYGEFTFVGRYFGNDGSLLGQQGIVNYRASFRIKDFSFHYVFENSLSAVYQAREQYTNIGRYSWYWVTWNFFN